MTMKQYLFLFSISSVQSYIEQARKTQDLYAGSYMRGYEQTGRFYLYIGVFMTSMIGLVLSDNMITLFVFWELTSISSYLLIGFNHHKESSIFITLFSIALFIMLILSFIRKFKAGFSQNSENASKYTLNTRENSTTLSILGMTCNHCANHVKEAIQSVRGVTQVDVFLQKKNAIIKGDFSLDEVKAAVKDAGYSISSG